MKLAELLSGIEIKEGCYDPELEITGVSYDSRQTKPGEAFVAIPGFASDGYRFIPKALERGAAVVICEREPEQKTQYVQVASCRRALARLGANWFSHPADKMTMIGVTGTNGKTSITYLLKTVLEQTLGAKVGLIGTIQNMIGTEVIHTERTTPESFELQKLFAQMADAGCTHCVMEVSSHALVLHRADEISFETGIFTNLTRDHLDYHKTVENYLKAKKKFFDDMPKNAFSLTNLDDKNGLVMTQNTRSRVYTYSLRSLSDFKGKILESHFEGMLLDFNNRELAVRFIGKFNAYNLLAVFGAAVLLGKKEEDVLIALSTLHPVAGRFDSIRSPKGITAIVDYAHTPDALVNVLNAIHDVLEGKGKVITVVGAGGNRDKGKRPIMAKESARLSDRVIITSDNPRFEEPQDIINDMLAGLDKDDMQKTISITDRKEAIKTAYMLAQPGDVILIAGKGHENYQEIKGVKHHFDDKEIIKEIMN